MERYSFQFSTDKILFRIKSQLKVEPVLNRLEINYKSYERLGNDENSYFLTLTTGESIQVSQQLFESGYFEYAQPSFFRLVEINPFP